jgi:dTDP-L-rhamnose 4-epimerase
VATSIRRVAQLLAAGLRRELAPEIVGKYRAGDIRHCVPDISRARALLGYQPRVTLEQGVAELLDWVRRQEARDHVAEATAELEARALVR